MAKIRSPVCTVVGHVDHGKSSILDRIRGTAIVETEAGKITQAIGASIIPIDVIEKVAGPLLKATGIKFTIPGLLFIDTPGHAAFTSLRKRGGSLADIAILVVNINEGFMPQTNEAVEILKAAKTPFVVAANQIDLLPGWRSDPESPIVGSITKQSLETQKTFETKMYEIVGKLSEYGFDSERFDRVDDYTKQVAIIPTSASTGEGLPELLMVISGLAQKFLEQNLSFDVAGPARGTILEIKEGRGLGKTLDVVLYDGTLKVNDIIVIGGTEVPIVTKVKTLLEPVPLAEMRDKKANFNQVNEASAATGVRISAKEIEDAIAGMPIMAANEDNLEQIKQDVQQQVLGVMIETDEEGLVIKADSLGSLEALITLLRENNIPIRKAAIGDISKKDVSDAHSNYDKDPLMSVILGFNVNYPPEVKHQQVQVFTNSVIYRLIDDLKKWQEDQRKKIEASDLDVLVRPCKFELLKGYTFRQSNPAVIGSYVLAGTLKSGIPVMNAEGKELTRVKGIQQEQKPVEKLKQGEQGALSMDGVTVGRQINEGDIFYSSIPENDFKKLKDLKSYLSKEEVVVIKEIAKIKRKDNPVWGV